MTAIEWTHVPGYRGETWNPVVGCSVVSPGCARCYAMKQAGRLLDGNPKTPHYGGTTRVVNGNTVWTGKVAKAPERTLAAPLRWTKPRAVFVNSMGDLFHEAVPDAWIDRAFAVMALCPQHIFMVLTKRAKRMRDYLEHPAQKMRVCCAAEKWRHPARTPDGLPASGPFWPLKNVWLGVSAEDQPRAEERIPDLLQTHAAVRFVSYEPGLGPADLRSWMPGCYECGLSCGKRLGDRPFNERCVACGWESSDPPVSSDGCPACGGEELDAVCPDCGHYMVHQHPDSVHLDWVIAGGESGPDARPMHPDWARALRDQCAESGTPFFFKQWGAWREVTPDEAVAMTFPPEKLRILPAFENCDISEELLMARVGKAKAGAALDGAEHRAFPACVAQGRAS